MPNSTIYEEEYVLPGGGGNNAFIKPKTQADPLPQQPQPLAQMLPNENMRINSMPPKDPDNLPLQTPQSVNTRTQRTYNPQPPEETIPQQPQNDKPMQPAARPNLFAKQAEPATFSNLNIPSQGAKTYTPSASNPTQSVYDYMLQPSEEEKKLYKDNESKKRLLLLGDALRHLGNLYFTTKGATPQQFTSPVVQQEQQYQQKRQELRAQRAAALKNAMDQAKLQADQNYKNSMLGMRQAELERGLANDEWNRQWNQFKWAGDQANKDREFDFKKANADRTFAETVRSNKANEGLRRQSNSTAAMNAKTARDRLNWDMTQNGLGKGSYRYVTPEGVTYSLSKNFTKPANLATIYAQFKKYGLINADTNDKSKSKEDYIMELLADKSGTKSNEMLSDIMRAATKSKSGHDLFVYYGKRLGYQYEGGMTDKLSNQLGITGSTPTQTKPTAKPQSVGDKYSKYERK